jgi:hypothetical protein
VESVSSEDDLGREQRAPCKPEKLSSQVRVCVVSAYHEEERTFALPRFSFVEETMFSQWLENLNLMLGEGNELLSLDELKRLFEGGHSELDAWAMLAGEWIASED